MIDPIKPDPIKHNKCTNPKEILLKDVIDNKWVFTFIGQDDLHHKYQLIWGISFLYELILVIKDLDQKCKFNIDCPIIHIIFKKTYKGVILNNSALMGEPIIYRKLPSDKIIPFPDIDDIVTEYIRYEPSTCRGTLGLQCDDHDNSSELLCPTWNGCTWTPGQKLVDNPAWKKLSKKIFDQFTMSDLIDIINIVNLSKPVTSVKFSDCK